MSIEISLSDVITIISLAIATITHMRCSQQVNPPRRLFTWSLFTGLSINDKTMHFRIQKTERQELGERGK